MSKVGKKHRAAREAVGAAEALPLQEALQKVISTAHTKFDESVDVDVVLGIDATKGDQGVRGAVLLPHGTGKQVRVVAFAKGEYEEAAQKAGADYVGVEDLIEKIQGGWTGFDAAVATPDLMGAVGKVARVLGPRGLLPNKKIGTVTFDIASIVDELKKGRVSYRNDNTGVLHAPFGKVSFGAEKLAENLKALLKAVVASKPTASRGRYIRKVSISSSMGIGMEVQLDNIL